MVLIEAPVLRDNDGMLQIGRDLAERNKLVAFPILRVVKPGLETALDVHCGCRWVDPPRGEKDHRGKRPRKHHTDDKPAYKGSKKPLPKRRLGVSIWPFSHPF